jgi:molybdopterin-guanine dinucleotide biosynthesis protein B
VLVSSANRWALMSELRGAPEPTLAELLRRFDDVDLVIVEGFKRDTHPKIEVHRGANAKPWLHPQDPRIAAIASDIAPPEDRLPRAHLDDIAAIADLVLAHAMPLRDFLAGG